MPSTSASLVQFPRLPSPSSSWHNSSADSRRLPSYPLPPRAARTLKESRSSESLSHRKTRVDFLRQREWTRRAAAGGVPPTHTPTYSWEDIVAAADAAANTYDYSSDAGRPGALDADTDTDGADEPYVIYTASPRPPQSARPYPYSCSPPSPAYTLAAPRTVIYSTSPSPPSTPSPPPGGAPLPSSANLRDVSAMGIGLGAPQHARRASWRGPHSRHSSLSSISEEDEGLARF